MITVRVSDWRRLRTNSDLRPLLDLAERDVSEACRRQKGIQEVGLVEVRLETQSGNLLAAAQKNLSKNLPSHNWSINNYYDSAVNAEAQREGEIAREASIKQEREKARADALALQAAFKSQHNVDTWVTAELLRANPFIYKDKIIGLHARFTQMLGDGEALFGEVVGEGVPNTMFVRSGTSVILAMRITGLKPTRTPVGLQISLPVGRYIGAYTCKSDDCGEFIGPR
jgi:hypothetical protein